MAVNIGGFTGQTASKEEVENHLTSDL